MGSIPLLVLGSWACKAAAPSTAPRSRGDSHEDPGGAADQGGADRAYGDEALDEIDQLGAELMAAQAELQELQSPRAEVTGTSTHTPATSPTPAVESREDRCVRIKALAERICELREKICALADEHADSSRYATACHDAAQTCDNASASVDTCE